MEISIQKSFIDESYVISLALFNNVTNCDELKNMAMKRQIDAALLKPERIVDAFQVLLAANKALSNFQANSMLTKTLHSEVIFSLSASKSISDSFKFFGIEKDNHCLLIVEISKNGESNLEEICSKVRGDPLKIDLIEKFTNLSAIKKIYKIDESELAYKTVNDVVYSRMAAKGIVVS